MGLVIAFGCLVMIGAILVGVNHLAQKPFKKVAKEYGLEGTFPGFGPPKQLSGKVGNYHVRIESIGDRSGHELSMKVMLRKKAFKKRFKDDETLCLSHRTVVYTI